MEIQTNLDDSISISTIGIYTPNSKILGDS